MRTTQSFDRKTLQGGPHSTGPHPVGSGFRGIYMTVLEEGLAAKAKLGLLDTTTEEFIFLEDLEFLENDFTDLHSAITDSRGISWVANRSPKVILKEEGVVDRELDFTFSSPSITYTTPPGNTLPQGLAYDVANRLIYISTLLGYEVFNESEEHVRSIPTAGSNQYTYLSSDGSRIYRTFFGDDEIQEFDPVVGYHVILYQQDSQDVYRFSQMAVHPNTGELWGLVTQQKSGEQYKIRFIRVDPGSSPSTNTSPGGGTMLEDIVIYDWDADPDNYHFTEATVFDFEGGFVYWVGGENRIGRYDMNTGEVVPDFYPNIFGGGL